MFILIVTTLLFSVGRSKPDTGASVEGTPFCDKGFCITLSEGEITAEAGLCVVIPCSFTTSDGFTPQNIVWYKCEPSKQKCTDSDIIFHTNKKNNKIQSGFKGRVSLLEPDVSRGNCSIIVNDLTESDSGLYKLRVNGFLNGRTDGFTFSPGTTVSVKDLTQKPTVMIPPMTEGKQSTLSCTAPGLCSGSDPEITWTWTGAGEKDSHIAGNIIDFRTENLTAVTQRHSSTLTFNSSAEHHGTNVSCKVSFTNNITTEETVTLNVVWFSTVGKNSGCEVRSEVVTCVCISEGFPLPTITWPLLKNHAEYSVITTVAHHTVNSTVTLTVKDHIYTTVECVSSSHIGEIKAKLIVQLKTSEQPTKFKEMLNTVSWLEVIIAFLIGILLSTVLCCLAKKCHRKQQKSFGNLDETLEMVTSQEDPMIAAGQAVEDETYYQEASEGEEEAVAQEQAAPDLNGGPQDVEYASIDFSLLKTKNPRMAAKKQETTKTEYAEIKKDVKAEIEDNGGEEGDVLEGNDKEGTIGDEEIEQFFPEEEEGEDMAVYSNVKDIMGEI
ncbi:sialic acid-binding Ig-like lectin 12 isoform X4 [Etheostoma cragini]|uniref:sialic acid-binding Ig-like lectin 12 isoform X4 n=1 Tax=Etheostoma cragini TaxID=417921 RepID=UPI00155E6116|nr:sialic acid-binding Ig-like lectin 12 isoform X4 [Etheostoma cragini]